MSVAAGIVVFLFSLYWAWTTLDFLRVMVNREFVMDVPHLIAALVIVSGWVAILT